MLASFVFWSMILILVAIVATTPFLAARYQTTAAEPRVFWLPLAGILMVSAYIVWYYATQVN